MLMDESGYVPSNRQYQRGGVIVFAVARHHIGSSPLIHDRRPINFPPEISADLVKVVVRPIVEQVRELLAALSLNKSQLAKILRVARPTIYEWLQGKEPNPANTDRLHTLLRILDRASVSSVAPLNARFVRQPAGSDSLSLIDQLIEEQINEDRLLQVIKQVQDLGDQASQMRASREDRLRRLGFEDPDEEQRREQLARNVALKDWPV